MAVPKFLQPYLASYDLTKLDLKRDKDIIITELLNKGDGEALKWLVNRYSKTEIKKFVISPMRGMWLKSTLNYWLKVFGIKENKEKFREAVINLNPR